MDFRFQQKDETLPSTKLSEIRNEISISINFLKANIDRLIEYLRKEDALNNYIEIDLPVLDLSINYKLSLFYNKLIISVVKFDNSEFYGHLMLDGYDCLDENGIMNLGDWNTHQANLKRFNELLDV